MPDPDYRALCAELVDEWDAAAGDHDLLSFADAMDRARALLAQPEPVGPTDEDVTELFYRHMGEGSEVGFENAIAEALARWGTPSAIEPVPVVERLPGVGDCDAGGFCWFWDYGWTRQQRGWHDDECTHWLPHWALPVPAIAAELEAQ